MPMLGPKPANQGVVSSGYAVVTLLLVQKP